MIDAIEKSRVALRAFFKIARLWRLDQKEQLALFGQTDLVTIATTEISILATGNCLGKLVVEIALGCLH